MTGDDLLKLVRGWVDPNPAPVLEEHEGVTVVRDDLLGYGAKIRFVDYLIGHDPEGKKVREWVFGSCPATGYAQISMPYICGRYGKEVHLFMAARDQVNLHPYQKRGLELGAVYHWVPMGFLNVTQARAREYAETAPKKRQLLPLGLEHPTVLASIVKVARSLKVKPKAVWTACGSGTLSRGLQLAFPEAEVHGVLCGHNLTERELGRMIAHRSSYAFARAVKPQELPPFPSAPTYDAKVWSILTSYYQTHPRPKGPVLFWNVGA